MGLQTAAAIHERLWRLRLDIQGTKELLARAATSGVEVTESQMEQTQADDALLKARVSIHSARLAQVEEDVEAGNKIVAKGQAAGNAALKESGYRRKGLALSVLAIMAVVFALGAYIRELERTP
jgi:hypothetical protein